MICESQRALVLGVLLIISLCLVNWKLNQNFDWNWFIVLLPLWTIDVFSAGIIILKWRRNHNGNSYDISNPLMGLFGWFLFKCLLCINLEEIIPINAFIIMFPLWMTLSLAIYLSFGVLRKFAGSSFA